MSDQHGADAPTAGDPPASPRASDPAAENASARPTFLDRFDTRSVLALILVVGFVALVFLLAIKNPDSDAFKVLVGALTGTALGAVVGWYFGSSKGSEDKTAALLRNDMPK